LLYALSLHDALPIYARGVGMSSFVSGTLRWVLVALLAVGCGAKTGLDVPDASLDAGVDAETDSAVPCIETPLDGGPIEVPLDIRSEEHTSELQSREK